MSRNQAEKIVIFQEILLDSFSANKYPWRGIQDPYKILISEFMLHRTNVKQVLPIYIDFIKKYPRIEDFIKENKEVLFHELTSLGLIWRINGLIRAINEIYSIYGKVIPDYNSLINIEGIGPYIAGAVICFSLNKPVRLIDTNTVRVIGRVFGLNLQGEARRRKDVKETIKTVTPITNPRDFYYSIIDLAHEICLPKKPKCSICPLNNLCEYRFTNIEK